jgi:hypothetical protein
MAVTIIGKGSQTSSVVLANILRVFSVCSKVADSGDVVTGILLE